MGHWFQATFALLSIDIDTQKKYLGKMHKIWIINTTYNANLMKHQQGISLLVPWFHSVFSLVSNWRILQHASQVLSKSAPNVYYGQNASMAAGVYYCHIKILELIHCMDSTSNEISTKYQTSWPVGQKALRWWTWQFWT